jgi:hypothetical protein
MYLLICYVDGEKKQMELGRREDVDWEIELFEIGTRYEVYKRGEDGFDFLYGLTKR